MTLKEMERVVSGLPQGARDMRDDVDSQLAALSSYTGKLSRALIYLVKDPDDVVTISNLATYCGASLLALAAIAAAHRIDLDEAVAAGAEEIRKS